MSEQSQNSSVTPSEYIPDFAPFDIKDGRKLGEWKSKYTNEALREIRYEAIYLVLLLFGCPLLMLLLFLSFPKSWLNVDDVIYKSILKYGLAWLGGTLGGTLFDLKWLYHSVARRIWHEDRRLWRLLTPHISGGLSFIVITLISSGLLRIFDNEAIDSRSLVVGIAFLVGYFSDSAVAKLAEIAETLFGSTHSQNEKNNKISDNNTNQQEIVPINQKKNQSQLAEKKNLRSIEESWNERTEKFQLALQWIAENRQDFLGKWICLDGDKLISHGDDAKKVYVEAKSKGIKVPFIEQIHQEETTPYWGGWD